MLYGMWVVFFTLVITEKNELYNVVFEIVKY